MIFSRSGRLEEKKQKKRLIMAIGGSVVLLAFLGLFGVKLLVGFSLLVDRLHGSAPVPSTQSQTIILPPVLDPQPIATKSSTLKITGSGEQGLTVILYINEKETKKTIVTKDGTFSTLLTIKDGTNTLSAKLADDKGNMSDLSNILSVSAKSTPPILEVESPEDNATINGESNLVTVSGHTEDGTSVTINGRLVVIKTDNSFSYPYPLNEGDNKLVIVASDQAGNKTQIERAIKYQK